jgi:hypothetical protein
MQLMYCIRNLTTTDTVENAAYSAHPIAQYCFLYVSVYADKAYVPIIPIFNHWGYTNTSDDSVVPCTWYVVVNYDVTG